jgi:hypothetical protein
VSELLITSIFGLFPVTVPRTTSHENNGNERRSNKIEMRPILYMYKVFTVQDGPESRLF